MAAADAELFAELAALLADDFVDVEVFEPLFVEVFDDDVADFDSVVEAEALPFDDGVAAEAEAAAELEALSFEAEADDAAAVDEAVADTLADVIEELVAEAAVELEALCEEPSTSGTCTLGSNGCGMNSGTTYKAKSAIIANTPTVPSTFGIFDFFTGDVASPRF